MNGTQAIQAALGSTKFVLEMLLGDFTDEELLVRPVAGANHLAWQIGHLIGSEISIVRGQLPDAVYPELPAGFKEAHEMGRTSDDGPAGFASKAEYLALFAAVRAASLTAVGHLTDDDLDRPTIGNMAGFCPKLGDMLLLIANHTMMHVGQFSVVRRKLGKPVMM